MSGGRRLSASTGWRLFPEEQGLKTDSDLSKRDAAIAAWAQFAERITQDANAPFPASP